MKVKIISTIFVIAAVSVSLGLILWLRSETVPVVTPQTQEQSASLQVNNQPPTTQNQNKGALIKIPGAVELDFTVMSAKPSTKIPIQFATALASTTLAKNIYVYLLDKEKGDRVNVTDVKEGTGCEIGNFFVEKLSLSQDQKSLHIFHMNQSGHYLTTISTETCKVTEKTKSATE